LLRAFAEFAKETKLPDSILWIIGNGLMKEHLIKLSEDLNIKEKVVFWDFMAKNPLVKLINRAKIAVLPSKCFETASMLVFEAVASSVVPIVANHGGMREMVNWL